MKPFFRFAFLLLGFFVFLFCVKAEHLTVSDKVNIQSVKPYSSLSLYQAYEPVMMRANGFALEADSGSLQYDITIEMTVLPYKDGYAFSSDMENVTGECDGIRLLPNGNHFSSDNPARITLSYDPARIPMGYKAEDIYTYYCDTTSGVHGNDASSAFTWRRLERVSVDTVAHKVTSLTTHFTDFANAVIRIPEMPESKAFVPTAVTDMLDVDPMHGIPMVEAPSANNRATAELTYPIELPAGRLDMQPNVDLYYSSAGGNGILGVGWSLNLPAITLDTRWGVPRYDPVYESEQYMVNGAAVLFRENDGSAVPLPYQDNSFQPRRNGVVNFYARDTENQNRIIRVGTNPTDYWWAVTDRNGITTYYGRTFNPKDPNDRSIDESSVVRTDNGCIAYWAATATVDVHGNYILYANEKKNNTIYVKQIDYTGNVKQSVAPVYRVKFAYMNREDVSSSGRLGVLQMENRLLCHVLVQYHLPDRPQPEYADNLAAYYMQYTEPQEATLYKSRLAEVVKLDSVHDLMLDDVCSLDEITSGEVERNSLTKELLALMENSGDTMLYDQSMNNLRYPYGKNSLPASVTEFTYANAPSAKNLFSSAVLLSGADEMSLSKNYSRSWSVGGTATVGVGIQVFSTILTGGGNYDFRRSTGGNESMLLDLNGDGLTDIVYEEYGQVWYRRQYKQGSQYAFAPAVRVGGLTRLSRDVTNTHSWGLQLSLGANLSYTNPLSTTYTDTYFSDVNADGLPDMIDGDNILINQLVDGNPVFGEFTGVETQTISVNNSRCGEIILDGEVDEHLECDLEEVLVDSYPLEDFFGPSVDYEITAGEISEKQEEYPEMLYYDGSVIGNDSEKLYEEIDETTSNRPDISTPKYAQMAPSNAPLLIDSGLIYRIENGRVNVYRLEYVCNPLDADPDIETVRVWVAPKSGTITLTDSISLVENTSESRSRSLTADGISYTIQHCRNITPQGDGMHLHAGNYTLLRDGTVAADDYSVHSWSETLTVQKGDILMFRLRSGENNRYDKTVWRHIVSYSGETDVYDSQNDYVCSGNGYFQAHADGSVILSFSGRNEGLEPVALKVKRANGASSAYIVNTVLHPGNVNVPSLTLSVSENDSIIVTLSPVDNSVVEPRWSDIQLTPCLQYISDFLTNEATGATVRDTVVYYPDVQISHTSLYPASSAYRKLFGVLHKGWGAFAYQNLNDHDIIFLDSLVNTQLLAAEYARQNPSFSENQSAMSFSGEGDWASQVDAAFAESNLFNPISGTAYWVPMNADSRTGQWIAYGNLGCIGKSLHSNAREITIQDDVEDIVEYDSSIPFRQGETRKNNFVRKQSRSVQHSVSWGALGIMNASLSKGTYEVVVDYMDMNGDGYPDFVGKDGIQYSMPWGGIGKLQNVNRFSPFRSTNNTAGTSFSACTSEMQKLSGNGLRDGKFYLSGSCGASGASGGSSTIINFVDVNADGLPDKVDVENHTVCYNLGYTFSEPFEFSGNINEGSSSSGDLNVGGNRSPFSIAQVSISGGLGGSISDDRTYEMFFDVNGDGLPDKIKQVGTQVSVAYNRGMGSDGVLFETPQNVSNVTNISANQTLGYTTTLGVTGGFTISVVKIELGVKSSPWGESSTTGNVMITDMDGDGLPDYVWTKDDRIYVRYNTAGKANLLTAVTNPTGHQILLDYTLSEPTSRHRNRQWELRRIVNYLPNHPMTEAKDCITELEYGNAYYDNYEKTSYGYEYVRVETGGQKVNEAYYHNRSFLLNGELKESLLTDSDGNKYIRQIHGSRYTNMVTGSETGGDSICDDANAFVSKDGYWTEYYEAEETPQITTRYDIHYDRYHNIIEYVDEGDITVPGDDWRQIVTYLPNTANNMISLPKTEKVYDNSGQLLRSSSVSYSPWGQPAHIRMEDSLQNLTAVTHVKYDAFGNVTALISPENVNNERSWSYFAYDSLTYSYVVSIDNPFRLRTYTDYDYRWGLPLRTIDPAGNEMRYYYDYMGRLSRVLAPQELSHGKFYTVRYEYRLINNDLVYTPAYDYTHVYKSMYDSLFTQQEVSLYDQLGRNIQKKHYAEVNGDDMWVVDGAEEWDTFGRVIASEIPFVAQRSSYVYEPLDNNRPITRFKYDVQDRLVDQYNADGSSKRISYHFDRDAGNVLRFSSNMIDENGIKTIVLKSPQDWNVQQVAGDGSKTFFEYTPIGELYCATDPDGYSTHYKYNMFGQVKERDHPDAGRTIWQYDLAGNVVSKQTANLLQHNEAVEYKYSYNRLSEVVYPVHPENNVRYVYDNAGRIAGRVDGTGREEFVYDRMGNVAQSLRRVVLPVDGYVYVFKTQFKYDSFGRIRNIVYPDGEVLHYGYTTGGLLKSVAGIKHGQQNIYLWDRVYDEQGRTIVRLAGNGVMTKYSYDSKRQWLNAMHTELPDATPVQKLSYKYDAVGNILAINQSAPAWTDPVLGGAYVNNHVYDSQYRLVKSTGTGDFSYYQNASYSPAGRMGSKFTDTPLGRSDLLFGYDSYRYTHQPRTAYDSNVGEMAFFWDAAGNMVQSISCSRNAGRFHEWDEENRLRFVLGVKYAGYYGYDANGERVYKLVGTSAVDQLNAGYTKAQVMFDDAVLYPNPYMVVTRKGYTKHYYAGTERLAASIGRGGFADMVQPVDTELSEPEKLQIKAFSEWYAQYDPFRQKDLLLKAVSTVDIKGEKREELDYHCGAVHLEYIDLLAHRDILLEAVKSNAYINDNEVEQYYYHADHLGSANWITNRNGRPVQYIHYAPYGELVANQFSRDYNERYKFTGKERDAETGYDYFGARYYYGPWGHWLSVDPLSDKYPTISSYAYCMWNPVKYVDPDGKAIDIIWDAGFVLYDLGAAIFNHINGDHQAAISNWVDLGVDVVAMFIPCVPAGMSKVAKGGVKFADKSATVGKGLKNAEAIQKGKDFERAALQETKEKGLNVSTQKRLVPQNGKGNVKGNRTTTDQLIKYEDNTYEIVETKLSPDTKLSKGQQSAKEHVMNGDGMFEVRSEIPEFDLHPGEVIYVKKYTITTKYE